MHTAARQPLRKVPRFPDSDPEPRYWHPYGWVIYRCTRDWDLGGITRGAQHQWTPKQWWEVKRKHSNSRRREDFPTLRDARAWCDKHNAGWPSQ